MEYFNTTTVVVVADELISRVVQGIDGIFLLFIIFCELFFIDKLAPV